MESAFITVNKAHLSCCAVFSCKTTSCSNPTLLSHHTHSCTSECGWREKLQHAIWSHFQLLVINPKRALDAVQQLSLYLPNQLAFLFSYVLISFFLLQLLTSSPPASFWADDLVLSFSEKWEALRRGLRRPQHHLSLSFPICSLTLCLSSCYYEWIEHAALEGLLS